MTSSYAIPSAVIVISLIACVTDLRTRRIPNMLTFGAALTVSSHTRRRRPGGRVDRRRRLADRAR